MAEKEPHIRDETERITAPGVAYGPQTLRQGTHSEQCTSEAWHDELQACRKKLWRDTPQGRAGIRLFSRGLLGAAAFAFGGWWASNAVGMRGYSRTGWDKSKPLQWIAKGFDTFAGTPIKTVVNALGGNGEAAVSFRATHYKWAGSATGRTLGQEIVGITTDFACASVGDALGRDIADRVNEAVAGEDPLKEWRGENGRVTPGAALGSTVKTAWRYFTYNGGEDWAVALPYAYWMKATRSAWNKVFPGFKYDFDRSLNGGSFKIDDHGNIKGNYAMAGLLNLQERFMVYNMGTLMFREAYNYVDDLIHGRPTSLYRGPKTAEERAKETFPERAGNVVKWMARDVIKAGIYMTPAVPFFWMFRTPQSKYKAAFIHPETQSMLSYKHGEKVESVRATELWRHHDDGFKFSTETPVLLRRYGGRGEDWSTVSAPNLRSPLAGGHFDPYAHTFGAFDSTLNALGKVNNKTARATHVPSRIMGYRLDPSKMPGYTRMANRFVNAAFAYTPYMYAKTEFANMWDTGKMDLAAERLVDGVFSLKPGEISAGLGEVWNTIRGAPLADPAREAEAKERIRTDTSAADTFAEDGVRPAFPVGDRRSFQERIIQGRAEEKQSENTQEKPKTHVDQVALRKALEHMRPPTGSIH